MNDPVIFRANERYKAIANATFQLGTALLAASVVRLYVDQVFGLEVLVWLISTGILILIGWQILGLLQPEDRS